MTGPDRPPADETRHIRWYDHVELDATLYSHHAYPRPERPVVDEIAGPVEDSARRIAGWARAASALFVFGLLLGAIVLHGGPW